MFIAIKIVANITNWQSYYQKNPIIYIDGKHITYKILYLKKNNTGILIFGQKPHLNFL